MRLVLLLLLFPIALSILACSTEPLAPPVDPVDGVLVARGDELFKGLAACNFCHGEPGDPRSLPVGGMVQFDRYGAVRAANLTPSPSGLAGWGAAEIVEVLRGGRGRSSRYLSQEVHIGYEWMAERDILALAAYLKSLPPVDREIERREVSFVERHTKGFLERSRQVTGYVPGINPKYEVAYGKYLADHVARCSSCHNSEAGLLLGEEDYLGGGKVIRRSDRELLAPNITASEDFGIGNWREEDIVNYLRSGVTPDGKASDPQFCPVEYYRRADQGDLNALAKFLKTVPASG